ncbi:putative monooxygenase [Wickerhamomyces ciferrii]|uniref:Monooxygenase n=1 Tax=Wickerhamomyces ciferrii (strain ATCC 14091 / BCRC 22168 / CBS 111 / JCM 3599 / NBRC 0793 / NRRL Y-1031 F-60-10) TaxID=1206466 RepID=K0KR83_WICCF|nr:putative monooxygenase [Wickerhamomyces ciferrii]CCH44607.1 putative monooxygenase [Wickerhamomyces ciferrii]
MPNPLILSVATKATSTTGWRSPNDESRFLPNDINALIKFAQTAERGKFHNLFFIDHLSWFDVYGDSHEASARSGANATRVDPLITISALATHTENIGFVATASTVSEHPYHFARRIASLDLLTKGRVGWNIVGSYIPSIGKNLLNGEPFPDHDDRYSKTEEYLDSLYELLLSSWRDDAVVYDKQNGIFADPDAIREINHEGRFFKIKGPAITEPTPQRFPLIAQAGNSERGVKFAAENAELIYIGYDSLPKIKEIRRLASEHFNRDPQNIKFITGISPVLGRTHEEAQAKYEAFKEKVDLEGNLVLFGGVTGIDLSGYDWDDDVDLPDKTNGIKSALENIKNKRQKIQTKRDIANRHWANFHYGTAKELADEIERLHKEFGIDGVNFSLNNFPESLDDLVDLLIPELQHRGLAQTEYAVEGGTLRENLNNNPGQTFLSGDHPAYNLRWRSGVSQKQFEAELELYNKLKEERRRGIANDTVRV